MSERLDPNTGNPPEPILQYFNFEQSVTYPADICASFLQLACEIVAIVPRNPERTVALRKLLEAKDAAVRAVISK